MKDRRAVFFFGSAVICALLVFPTEADLRWLPIALAIAYVLMAAASYLDYRSRLAGLDDHGREPPTTNPDQPNRPVM